MLNRYWLLKILICNTHLTPCLPQSQFPAKTELCYQGFTTRPLQQVTAQFHGRVFHGYGYGDNRPRENPSMREISNTEGYSRGQFAEKFAGTFNARGPNYYQYTTVYTSNRAREILAHGTAGTAHRGTGAGTSAPRPRTRETPAHGTGGLVQ